MADRSELLRRACREGVRSLSVELEVRGQPVTVAARHFELATGLPANLAETERAGVQAAILITSLRPDQVARVDEADRAGDEKAHKAYQAIVLARLVKRHQEARALVSASLTGDKRARAKVERAFGVAMGRVAAPMTEKKQATVLAHFVRHAMTELCELGQGAPAGEIAKSASPAPAPTSQTNTSAAIEFSEDGTPRIAGGPEASA